MKKHLFGRILSLVLAAVMVLGMFPAVSAAPAGLRWAKSDLEVSWDMTDRLIQDDAQDLTAHKPTDMVRVSIVLEDAPTIRAGYATMDIGSNAEAMAYDLNLNKVQKVMEKTISVQALDGKSLDVVWNLTLVSNIISANIPYGKIEAIKAIDGIRDVVIERRYETTGAETVSPDMYTSAGMIGSVPVWAAGMTGAGSRVAIIDTGTDIDHQSFDNGAYLHALEQNAEARGMSYDAYVASLDLLDTQEIASVLTMLNAYERIYEKDASKYRISDKLPFGANYVDKSLDVTHDHDQQGSHGSHVAGIAAANRYINVNGSYESARDAVCMSGVAPDAQIITLKVFGANPGPSDSDYFAAIEDAIWLGCDSVNLSLGSGSPGFAENYLFEDLLDYMATTDTVVVISAGNSGHWAEYTAPTNLYADGVSFQTNGSPGSYTNSLSVASVDNDGTVGTYIQASGVRFLYTETNYLNAPIATMDTTDDGSGTEYDYIFINDYGYPTDYEGMELTGKVVFCLRGDISFAEKANTAASLGAAAIIVCNDTDEALGMDLTDYRYSVPCVSILKSDADAVMAASTLRTTSNGLPYYTGKITISGKLSVTEYNSEYYTMSSFSSWGIPSSLELKPEITAPGGMIWSVNGVDPSGSAYEMMSGTSMAAPQVTGMAALVAEYIKSEGLDEKTGLSVRHLAQSLLMSTAEPLREEASGGGYYSILNQGAGLARVDLATTAESFIRMHSDGKVKAELGDDPERSGVYSFSFDIVNLDNSALSYTLSADVFTQDLFEDEHGNIFLDTKTRNLLTETSFTADGVSIETIEGFDCDLNGDGTTTAADADYLLEYLLGNESELHADGDVSGDGEVNTYDAHVLLTRQTGSFTVDVPANGSVTVGVTLELTGEAKEYLDTHYPTGAYIEAFVYAAPISDSEGVEHVTHSIPVLGYYGSWSEPSMYDVGSYIEHTYGIETRTPYLYQYNQLQSNLLTITKGDGNEYILGGNPFTEEAEYLPQRNAFNNASGATLDKLRFTQIRNAGNALLTLTDAESGEIYLSEELGAYETAYFHTNLGQWVNHQHRLPLGLDLGTYPEGTRLNLTLAVAPEYYCHYEADEKGNPVGYTDWEALSEGAYLSFPITIDNTAPVIKNVVLGDDNTLQITAKDNEYIAAVALMNAAGTSVITAAPANQTERGTQITADLPLHYVFGKEFQVAVFDYAENYAVYEIELELDSERPYFTAIDRTNLNSDYSANYVGMDADGVTVNLAPATDRIVPRAAEYVEGAVFEVTHDNKLYVGFDDDLYGIRYLRDLDPTGELEMVGFCDIAYNRADGRLYGLFYSQKNDVATPYLTTIDLYSGALNVLGEMPIDANTLAIDGNGNFYSTIFGDSQLHKYASDVVTTGKTTFMGPLVGDLGYYGTSAISSMAWDHNTGELYWGCTDTNFGTTVLLKVDPASGSLTTVHEYPFLFCGLYIAYETQSDLFAPADHVTAVMMAETESTLAGNTVQLSAQIAPWNASDRTITWRSSNEGVATVDANGLVTGVQAGTAVITATSVLDPTKSASCTVTVSALNKELNAVIWDEEGTVWWSEFNTDTLPAFEKVSRTDLPVNATMVADGVLYASTLDTSAGTSELYTVDPETFDMTLVGGSVDAGYLDMAYGPGSGYGFATYFNYILVVDPSTGDYEGLWDWSEGMTSDLVGITYYGSEYNETYGGTMDFFLILDADGNVYLEAILINEIGAGYFSGPYDGYIMNIGEAVDYSYFQGFHFDGTFTYWSRFNEADNQVELLAWDTDGTGRVYDLGTFPEGVWPVGGLYSDAELATGNALIDEKYATASFKSTELLTSIEAAELSGGAKGSLNAVSGIADQPMDKGEVSAVTSMPEDGTNGRLTVSYDASMLELSGVAGRTEAFAWKLVSEGNVEIAFADRDTLAADADFAVLTFKPLDDGDTTLSVRYTEFGSESSNLTQEIPLNISAYNPFTDVPEGQWYYDPVLWAVKKGITTGTSATTFDPDGKCMRAVVVTFLWRAKGCPEPTSTENPFTDVKETDYFYKAVLWALENEITNGISATEFGSETYCNRAQVVTFLWRTMGKPASSADVSFRDVEDGKFYTEAVAWAVENNITNGISATEFGVDGTCNRAQVVTFLYRTLAE